jgi:hypothetical protein
MKNIRGAPAITTDPLGPILRRVRELGLEPTGERDSTLRRACKHRSHFSLPIENNGPVTIHRGFAGFFHTSIELEHCRRTAGIMIRLDNSARHVKDCVRLVRPISQRLYGYIRRHHE